MDSNTNTNAGNFASLLADTWWVLALRGIAAIVFGVLAFIWPGMTLLTLTFLFGAYALAHGILTLVMALRGTGGSRRSGSLIFEGIISIAAGVIAFVWPGITTLTLLFLIAAWAIVNGVSEIITAIRLRKVIRGEWLLILAGVLSLLFGLIILSRPLVGALAVVWWIGSFAIVFGALLIGLAFRARHWKPETPSATAHA